MKKTLAERWEIENEETGFRILSESDEEQEMPNEDKEE